MDKSIFNKAPLSDTCDCIICHRQGVKASDEHIIPKALGGYMHTWRVCTQCNSRMGSSIDPLLTNHHLVRFERHKHQLKGQSGESVISPLVGTFMGEDGQRYKIEEEGGKLVPHIIGGKPTVSADGSQLTFCVDARDTDKIQGIVASVCQRKGLPIPKSLPEWKVQTSPSPAINMQFSIDIAAFRLAMLKIAYEFTANIIPDYVDDAHARLIAGALHDADQLRLDEIGVGANAFENDLFQKILGKYVDFTKDTRHYLLLINLEDKLYCFVKLFNLFCVPIKMSERPYAECNDSVIAINDFATHDFDVFTLGELIQHVQTETKTGVKLAEPYQTQLQIWHSMGFYGDGAGHNLCFDLAGHCLGRDIDVMKTFQEEQIETLLDDNCSRIVYHCDGNICVGLAPLGWLLPIDEMVILTGHKKY